MINWFSRNKFLVCCLVIVMTVALLAGCGSKPEQAQPTQTPAPEKQAQSSAKYANPNALISVEDLAKEMKNPNLVLLDIRVKDQYAQGHIPGAINIYRPDYENAAAKVKGTRANVDQFEALMSKLGITNDSNIVIYAGDSSDDATRVFWLMDMYGVKNVKLLNGGINKYIDAGNKTNTDVPTVKPSQYKIDSTKVKTTTVIETPAVKEALQDKKAVVIDCRPASFYNGDESKNDVKGRIDGSINIEWKQDIAKDKTFKSADELKKVYADKGVTPDKEIITYCNSGVQASNTWFALTQLLGYTNVKNYDDSWYGWSADKSLPVATGPATK